MSRPEDDALDRLAGRIFLNGSEQREHDKDIATVRADLERQREENARLVNALDGMARAPYGEYQKAHERAEAAEAELERIRQALIDTTEDVLASVGEWVAGAPEPNKEVLDAIDRRMGQNRALLDASPSDGGGA